MRDLTPLTWYDLPCLGDAQLHRIDPLVINLLIAQGLPGLAQLDIPRYERTADTWAEHLAKLLPGLEEEFHKTPEHWRNDLVFFRLGMLCWYIDEVLHVRYKEDYRELKRVTYTDPGDLFLNGVMDTRQGTCANMATLFMALAWRFSWPVAIVCAGSHNFCRYDDGKVVHNIEMSNNRGGFHSDADEHYIKWKRLPLKAIRCGSDMRALRPREMVGLFFGFRARYLENTDDFVKAEPDYLLARSLFPTNRNLYIAQTQISVQNSIQLFEAGEKGHPIEFADWLRQLVYLSPWESASVHQPNQEVLHEDIIDTVFQQAYRPRTARSEPRFPGIRRG